MSHVPTGVAGLGRIVRLPLLEWSVRIAPRSIAIGWALIAVLVVLLILVIGTGDYPIAPDDVVSTLLGGGDAGTRFVIETLRLPRGLTGALVGAALGASGAIFQSITRNPLGSPDILGFAPGASVGALLVILVLGGGTFAIAAGAFVAAMATAVIVYALAFKHGVQGYRLVLVGIAISFMLIAVINYLLSRAALEHALTAQVWLTGSLNGRGWEHVGPVAAALLVLLPLTVLLARPLRMLELGDETAGALGVAIERSRLALIFIGVALTAVAVASAGPVMFVALAAPQIARRLTRATGPGVGCAALTGAVLLVGADYASQRLFGDTHLPVGVLTGLLGGLYLIWLLTREWRKGTA
jgi:iron complex transport system permease protein